MSNTETDDIEFTCWCGITGSFDEMFDDLVYYDRCGGSGVLYCECGGCGLCVCHHHGEVECPGCDECRDMDDDYHEDEY